MKIMIAELRKHKGVSQQQLADVLGVSYQAVSKWETGVTLPDIMLLPELARYFSVTVDQLLGLKPLPTSPYIPSEAGTKAYWSNKQDFLKHSRKAMWNQDYLKFLVDVVWNIQRPVHMLDCGCGCGFFAESLLPLLPMGSRYTGIDFNECLLESARNTFADKEQIRFLQGDLLDYDTKEQYDLVLCQAVLRHVDNPAHFIEKMVSLARKGALVACIDVNREIEEVGLYLHGMDYGTLCAHPGYQKLWHTEQTLQGRDYSIGMKLPQMLQEAGLKDVDIRMNDKVSFISPESENYEEAVHDFLSAHGFGERKTYAQQAESVKHLMNHGMDREEAEAHCRKQDSIVEFIHNHRQTLSYTKLLGLLIAFGRK